MKDETLKVTMTHGRTRRPKFNVAILLLTLYACKTDETSVHRFESLRQQAVKAAESMAARSLLYRLDITPEEQEMQRLFTKVGSQSASPAELTHGLEIEETRRQDYIDAFDSEIEKVRSLTVELTQTAHTLRDPELRRAALKVCAHYDRLTEICFALAAAQRTRSVWTTAFLKALVERSATRRPVSGLPRRSELHRADEEAAQRRREMEMLYPQESTVYAEFKGIRQRRESTPGFLNQ